MTGLDRSTIVRYRSVPLERTPQRLDPLAVQSTWPVVPLVGAIAVVYAVASTLLHHDQLREPGLAMAALGLLVLAATVAAILTHPANAPLGTASNVGIAAATVAAACLFDAAVWGANERIQDDWGQIAVALFLLVMPLYRPVVEVLGVALLAAVVLGTLAALQGPSLVIAANPVVYATIAATPILVFAAGGAGYAWSLTGDTLRWREHARDAQAGLDGDLRQIAGRMVDQERMTALNAAAVPFLAAILSAGAITEDDRRRAGEIAQALRAAAVDAVERTWLAETVAVALASRGVDAAPLQGPSRVHDPDGLDRVLSDEQRAIVGALVATVAALPGLDPSSLHVEVGEPEHPVFLLTARVQQPRREVRAALLPLVSSLRSVSMRTSMTVKAGELVVRFAYPEGNS